VSARLASLPIFAFFALFLSTAAAPRVAASCADQVAATVQSHYDSVKDFSAEFEQTTRSALFGEAGSAQAEPTRGQVVFAKPGKMRWTYTHPEPSLVVSDGTTLWLYAPGLKEAQRLPVTEGYLTGAALHFLLGEGKLLESFDVSSESCPFEAAQEGEKQIAEAKAAGRPVDPMLGTVELDLVPKQPSSFERLGITARVASGEVVATRVVDLFGNETRIAFHNIERNQNPGPEIFTFVPGPDVEVIELQPAP
jgi:outer membrane lipoprotein-sorting protein